MRASSKWQLIRRVCAAAVLWCAVGALQAQTNDNAGDPPDRVARLSYIDGDVGLLPSGAHDWGDAGINRPLTRGDKLSSAAGARAELQLDGGTVRLDGQTDVGFLQLDNALTQLELTQGTLNLTVRQLDQGQSYEIDTPTVALVVDHPGSYRVDIDADGRATRVTAFDGSATVYGENNAQREVVAGRSYRFEDSSLANVALEDIGGGDDFDAWCDQRNRQLAGAQSRRYVSEDVIGYQDLDHYGQWRTDPDYGSVWYPSQVDVDWAPYRNGHWAWVGPWGWTWVDDAPWGFAPYHYGRWAWRDGWCWVPGPRLGWRPVYAPALVAFVGGGSWGVSFGVGAAPVGWFPLGPGEVYNPWYRSSRRYYTQVNVTNIYVHNDNRTVIVNRIDQHYDAWHRGMPMRDERYANRQAHGFTAVAGRNFADAERVQGHRLRVDPRQLAAATVLPGMATPKPTPRSFVPPRAPQAQPLPAQGFRREVVAVHAPRIEAPAERTARLQPRELPDNVHVLRPQGQPLPAVARILPADQARVADTRPDTPSRVFDRRTIEAANLPRGMAPSDAPLRPGELRSSRFVRSHEAAQPIMSAHDPDAPRPGVSFVSHGAPEHAAPAGRELPAVPRLQPADAPREPDAYRREDTPRFTPQVDRTELDRRQQMLREQAEERSPYSRSAEPAHMRAPDFDAQLHERSAPPAPQHFERAPDFRSMRPMPQAQPAPRPAPAVEHPAPARPHAPPHRFDEQH